MWWILLFLFLGILTWLLFAPISLEIDTTAALFRLQWKGIGSGQLDWIDNELVVHAKLFFWKKNIYPFRKSKSQKASKETEDKAKKTNKRSFSFKQIRHKGSRILKSFRLIHCHLQLDTDDYVKNSYLYPLFFMLSKKNRLLRINYQGNNSLLLKIENRLAKILYAWFF